MFGLCEYPGCKSASACRPTVLLKSRDKPKPARPGEAFIRLMDGQDCYEVHYDVQMEFCSGHRDSFRDKYLLNEASWSAIENQLKGNGMAPPDKDSVKIVWAPAAGADGLDEVGRKMVAVNRGEVLRA